MSDHDELDLFAQQLRADLHQAAGDVTPAPDGWARVQRRIRRRRTSWQAGGLALAGAAAAVVGVVALGGPDGEVVQFAPGVAATESPTPGELPQIATTEAVLPPAPTPDAAGIVYSDGDSIHVAGIDGTTLWTPAQGEETSTITDLTVRPGGTPEEFQMAYRFEVAGEAPACGDISWTFVAGPGNNPGGGVIPWVDGEEEACFGAPTFSTDGTALGWLATLTDGSVELWSSDWGDQGPFECCLHRTPLDLPADDPVLLEWDTGTLRIRMTGPDGLPYTEEIPAIRGSDGAVEVETVLAPLGMVANGIPRVLEADEGWVLGRPETPWQPDVPDGRELVWTLTTLSSDPSGSAWSELSWDLGEPLYLDGLGNSAIMGVGQGMVLAVLEPGQDHVTTGLPVATTAALLGPSAGPDVPPPSPDPATTTSPAPDMLAPPTPAVETAGTLHDAAEAGDWAAIEALIPSDGFTSSFGGNGSETPADHVARYQQLEADGTDILGIVADLLDREGSYLEQGDLWVWPPEFLAEGYYGWRIGITPDGTWRFLVAGD